MFSSIGTFAVEERVCLGRLHPNLSGGPKETAYDSAVGHHQLAHLLQEVVSSVLDPLSLYRKGFWEALAPRPKSHRLTFPSDAMSDELGHLDVQGAASLLTRTKDALRLSLSTPAS
jgi:hypothetical protein